ncbi:MAG: hypothetical protein IKB71_00110 [Lentisphaeria bacterium]|nr:hypothetical protein [Lentisphaeria bacterium]
MKYIFLLLLSIVFFMCGCTTTTTNIEKNLEPSHPEKTVEKKDIKEFDKGKFLPSNNNSKISSLANAYSIYKSSKYKPTGVHIYGGIVFVIVNIDTPKRTDRRNAKKRAMLRSQVMLRQYFSLPRKISFINRQLESTQYYSKKFYRYCLAYSLKDIQDYKKENNLK